MLLENTFSFSRRLRERIVEEFTLRIVAMFWLLPVSLPDDISEKCYHIDCRGIDGLMYSGTVNCDIDYASEPSVHQAKSL